jgi:hypothetical protein
MRFGPDMAALFDWLVSILSYQGIADQVAAERGRSRSFDMLYKIRV